MGKSKMAAVVSIGRIVVVGAIALGIYIITQRMIALSSATSDAVSFLNRSAMTTPSVVVPTDVELARAKSISDRIDVIADNLANAETQGFKRRRVDVNVGPIEKANDLQLDMQQGALENTGGPLDVGISGDGFFRIELDPNVGDGTGYIRMGALTRNSEGDLVVNSGPGYQLVPPINIPAAATNISIGSDGMIQYTSSSGKVMSAGQIKLSSFVNTQALQSEHGSIFLETAASGPPMINIPGQNGTGALQQGFLEASNVDPVTEWACLLKAQQLLQLNDRAVRVADQARQAIVNLRLSSSAQARID